MSCKSSQNDAATTCNRVAWFSLGSSTSVNFFAQGQAFGYSASSFTTSDPPDDCAAYNNDVYGSFCNFQFAVYYPMGTTSIFGPGIEYANDQAKNAELGVTEIYYNGSDSSISQTPFYALWVDLGYNEDDSGNYWFYDTLGVTMTITGGYNPTALSFLGWSEAGSGNYPDGYTKYT